MILCREEQGFVLVLCRKRVLTGNKNRIRRKGNNDFIPGGTGFCISVMQEPGFDREQE